MSEFSAVLKADKKEKMKLMPLLLKRQNGLCYITQKKISFERDYDKIAICYPSTCKKKEIKYIDNYYIAFEHSLFYLTAKGPSINGSNKIYFTHIPKNGGSSIRKLFDPKSESILNYKDRMRFAHLGYDINHLTLRAIEKYLPFEYDKIRHYNSFAVIRKPHERFISSLAQRVKWYKNKELIDLNLKELNNEVEEVIQYLSSNKKSIMLVDEFVHFQRQVDYIYNNNMQVVKNLYPIEEINNLIIYFEKIINGVEVNNKRIHANKTLAYKNNISKRLYKLSKHLIIKRYLNYMSDETKTKIKSLFLTNIQNKQISKICKSKKILDFINKYYSEDISLYNNVINDFKKS